MTGEPARAPLRNVLGGWRDDLVDLSGRNRLLNFRHTRTATLAVRSPAAGPLLLGLDAGLRFAEPPDDGAGTDEGDADGAAGTEAETGTGGVHADGRGHVPDGIVTQKTTRASLDASLRKLYRDSNQVFNDTGLWTLQLGAAFLKWREPGADGFCLAPLLLVPVRLERLGPGAHRLITEKDEEVTPNPALAVKMAQLGLRWPAADDMKDLFSAVSLVREAVAEHPDWEVSEDVVLATFRSHKEAMYRDLRDHEDQILAHPLVQAIGLGSKADLPDDALDFDPVDMARIDELQPPERTPLVLDADSSQRQCVAAALDGRSFVMDGPPGTGKSQTIANMIAALMHQGRSVLFVSEKAAALDVVRNRLDAVGLGAFVLSLHSHHASRKEVARTLGEALSQRPEAVGTDLEENRRRLLRTRRNLSDYAAAMNEPRSPLDLRLHDAIGRVSALADVPLLPVTLPAELTARGFLEITAAAKSLGESWRPVAGGSGFIWRDLKEGAAPHADLQLLRERADVLLRRSAAHSRLIEPLGPAGPGSTERLLDLLDSTADRPDVPVAWLTTPAPVPLRDAVGEFCTRLSDLRALTDSVAAEVGPSWDLLPATASADVPASEEALSGLALEGLELTALPEDRLQRLAAEFRSAEQLLRGARNSLTDIAAAYGMPAPETFDGSRALCRLTEFARRAHRPEADWLTSEGAAAAAASVQELERRVGALIRARNSASEVFTEQILDMPDFPALVQRFEDAHGIGKLSGAHRDDKRLLAGLTVSGSWNKQVARRLPQALAWHAEEAALREAVAAHARDLGRYWKGEETEFDLVRKVLDDATQLARLAEGVRFPAVLAGQLSADGTPDLAVCDTADQVRERLDGWRSTLVPAPQPGGRTRLGLGSLNEAIDWYSAHIHPLIAAAEVVGKVRAIRADPAPLTLAESRRVIGRIGALRARRDAFLSQRADDELLLGALYAGLETDTTALADALRWVDGVRADDAPLPPAAARALLDSGPDEELRRAWDAFRDAADGFVRMFNGPRRRDLHLRIMGTDASFKEITDEMATDRSGPDEWHAFRSAQALLGRYGLDDLVGRTRELGLDGGVFSRIVERAVLEAWIEDLLRSDSRLRPFRAVERDEQVELFRELDKALVDNAHAQVIEACNARRPRPNVGQAATIRREAEKKSRHMPVRTLLESTSEVVPRIKPCFMMSPLTVSQFLPPGYRFDVVIFDEASQVLPQDAVNCIYRGHSLIVAGDQKQLPPTDFFSQSEDSDDTEYDEEVPDSFESLLDMCKASGLIKSLSLSWHYRSRHEDLIAFSNHEFYRRDMVTFPGSRESGDDVGVTFTKVEGVYERGRSRSNPIEAAAVAERVLHHFSTRPHLSLGVVAMSESQARAIEDAVDRLCADRPDLDRFFSEDRLKGFFVKNLETVQGDERDVIILSVGYGPDQDGKLTMAFGPLNRENGWRRLNVAVTRARYRVEVVASISGGDIREGGNRSRNHFKRYLDYAEHGHAILEQGPISDDAEPESPFEESVLTFLLDRGYDVQPQVGVGGYRIDMAVRPPHAPGRFALGIECDGAMYHSSRAARDRDRLREEVLRGLGWNLHRIWGTDWYRDRPAAERRLLAAVEAAVAAVEHQEQAAPPASPAVTADDEERVTMVSDDGESERPWAAPYRRARLDMAYHYDMHLPESRPLLGRILRRILQVESPIRRDVLYRRAASVWYVERIGVRIRANLDRVLEELVRTDADVEQDGDTLSLRDRQIIARQPGEDVPRKVGEIPPPERKAALLGIIGESPGISEKELITETARFFGWHRRGADIARSLAQDLSELHEENRITGLPDRIVTHPQ